MSVIVKGMEMPENCGMCDLAHRNFDGNETRLACYALRKWAEESGDVKLPDCPLVELPEKHGRLIDAYELWNKMLNYTDNMGAKMPFGDDDSIIHRDSACFMIESADTIVEAEGVDE